ncbi:uncharacterized protein MONOS_13685 [Monocercomonoides exilis]|uniref:uncharacterized protein n=1 Tax=Monocercomonoides exilis TaxID=2049356 RepID=UPI00355977FF|nr:hypothetical protein MONOS_13685 [Monocercomonoides exilis]|eukprot:MONOS_13685.1-p1 / transcript=MONOS_13685.1 / gene=MONOS_13685 / organism=Monocercomonoides_exilis_PA203 / gene_product=unspecified product / transcript_product=unspecified product / location=Mono_scaffold00864:6752-7231(-) / protein_length=160 / sequence_SO=supercontig / SO=protein_coding / is_pseudo=false
MLQDTVHPPTPQQIMVLQRPEVDPREDTVREGASRDSYTDSSREGDTAKASRTSGGRRELHSSRPSSYQRPQGGQPLSLDHCPQLPQGLKEGQRWNHQSEPTSSRRSGEKEERVEREKREPHFAARPREEREANYNEMNIQRETVAPHETRSEKEVRKQ